MVKEDLDSKWTLKSEEKPTMREARGRIFYYGGTIRQSMASCRKYQKAMSLEHERKGKKEWHVMWWEARRQAGSEKIVLGSCGVESGWFKVQWEDIEGYKQSDMVYSHVWRMDWKKVCVEVQKLVESPGVCTGERYQWKWRWEKWRIWEVFWQRTDNLQVERMWGAREREEWPPCLWF